MKKLTFLFIIFLLLSGCNSKLLNKDYSSSTNDSHVSNYTVIKYRDTPVDLNKNFFEYVDTANDSLVKGIWYDASNQYMVIDLNGTYYHYCDLPRTTWDIFSHASNFENYYKLMIKGNYDCRLGYVPNY